ncbi:protein [Escherichia coli]|uniref:Protein n=1 Tax=Escherichia coli TaxID=562 RepID=A0A2X1LHY2_ECOLX|nr:protein [Escherichia coli]
MKKMQSIVLALSLVLVAPMAAQAAEITLVPSVKLQIGDRDNRGYYWDGGHWRDHGWWKQHYEMARQSLAPTRTAATAASP